MMIIGYSFRQNPTGRDCSAEQVRQNVFQAAIHDSALSTQDDFIYLINLKAFDAMTKMELIKRISRKSL